MLEKLLVLARGCPACGAPLTLPVTEAARRHYQDAPPGELVLTTECRWRWGATCGEIVPVYARDVQGARPR